MYMCIYIYIYIYIHIYPDRFSLRHVLSDGSLLHTVHPTCNIRIGKLGDSTQADSCL